MDNTLLPKWMVQALGMLLIIFLASLIINQLFGMKGAPQTMSVSGDGKVIAVPDLATVTIGVVSEGATPTAVRDSNNQKINQIIAFVKQLNIDAKDIQTTGFYSSPKYNYANGQSTLAGYQANQTITVKVRNIDKSQQQLEKMLTGVVSSGANQIQGVNFGFSDADKFKQAARKKAIAQAKQKAKELADDAGIRLGRVVNIVESSSNLTMPYPRMMSMAAKSKAVAPDIEPGTEEINETVTLMFEVH